MVKLLDNAFFTASIEGYLLKLTNKTAVTYRSLSNNLSQLLIAKVAPLYENNMKKQI